MEKKKKKRWVVVERTKFLKTRQDLNKSKIQYVHKLKETSKYDKLETKDRTTEDELILLRLIEGIHDKPYKHKILERLQISNMNLEVSKEFLQLEFIRVQPTKRLKRLTMQPSL